ncbi:TPA: SOS response-associated peptidase family protein [Stenotrophomonas maltophilia]|uniref:SOS response-associated peptidase family protein n=1 Tax=Stenotrophomonas maltophilia TaxID=40324 RepID=UPI002A90F87C|nr:SOS response-associated peptidase family protein [Stenotrophomonas maltophilia]
MGKGEEPARLYHQCPYRVARSTFHARGCLIPIAGYYEWSINPDDKMKYPGFIRSATPLRAAGAWGNASKLVGEDNLATFTVTTGDSSSVTADLHDRPLV